MSDTAIAKKTAEAISGFDDPTDKAARRERDILAARALLATIPVIDKEPDQNQFGAFYAMVKRATGEIPTSQMLAAFRMLGPRDAELLLNDHGYKSAEWAEQRNAFATV